MGNWRASPSPALPPCCHCHSTRASEAFPDPPLCAHGMSVLVPVFADLELRPLSVCSFPHTRFLFCRSCHSPRRGQHKVSISEAHFCAMDIEPGRKESRLLSMMDGFSRGLPRVVLKGARMEPRGSQLHNLPLFPRTSVLGVCLPCRQLSHLHSSRACPSSLVPLPPSSPSLQFT